MDNARFAERKNYDPKPNESFDLENGIAEHGDGRGTDRSCYVELASRGAGKAADSQGSRGGNPGTHWRAVEDANRGYLQSGESGDARDGNRGDDDGDTGCSAADGGERAEFDHHARADILQSLRRQAGRNGRERLGVEREARVH